MIFGFKQIIFETTMLSLIFSCLLFGFLFDIAGRKQIFTMRTCVTSISTILVPYITFFPIISLAVVMSTVSLTVPFVTDMVSYHKRGLAYSYLALTFVIAIVIM